MIGTHILDTYAVAYPDGVRVELLFMLRSQNHPRMIVASVTDGTGLNVGRVGVLQVDAFISDTNPIWNDVACIQLCDGVYHMAMAGVQ